MSVLRSDMLPVLAAVVLLLGSGFPARAAVILQASEVGSDVVIVGGGSFDLTGLVTTPVFAIEPSLNPTGFVLTGMTAGVSIHSIVSSTGPTSFGTAGLRLASFGSGDIFGFDFVNGVELATPQLYVSGAPLSGSSTYVGESFASLGLTPGSYTWNWGSGSSADSFTLNIVPEPSGALLVGVGLIALARRRAAISLGA